MPRRPNVLLITADQWRGDCLSAVGHPVVSTPNLDRLASEGVLFGRHYAQAAPCGPSRASLYTGMYMMNHRSVANGTPLDVRFTNLALEARVLGYDPCLFGYTDTSVDPRTVAPDDPRLTTYEGVLPGFTPTVHLPEGDPRPWLEWLTTFGYDVPSDFRRLDDPVPGYPGADRRGPTFAPPRYRAEHTQTAFLTGEVLAYLDDVGDAPWFVHVSYLRPHPPFVVPEPYNTLYDPADVPRPVRAPTLEEEGAQHPLLARALHNTLLTAPTDERDLRQLRATYYGMQAEVDHQIGRLLDGLDARGMRDDTIVVVTSDHGEMLGDHWILHKLAWFDESYHVPLIVRDPRASADPGRGRVVERFTENVDVMPTILDLLDAEVPAQCDGRSLATFLTTPDATPERWRAEVHWEFDFRDPRHTLVEDAFGVTMEEISLAVVRDDHGKYVHFGGLPPLFFDLDADPAMIRNRADDPGHAPRVLDYAQRLASWQMRHRERTLAGTILGPDGPVTRVAPRLG